LDLRKSGCHPSYESHVHTICLFVESILFGMFTTCILADQSTVLTTNEAKIDRLKCLNKSNSAIEQHHLLNSTQSSNINSRNHNYNITGSSSSCLQWECLIWNEWSSSSSSSLRGHHYLNVKIHSIINY